MSDAVTDPEPRVLCWFSCGAASAVATKLALTHRTSERPVEIVYCETGAEHPDNERFLADCERWFGQPVTRLKNEKYADTWHVWERERYLSGIEGAKCTSVLKVEPRLAFQRPHDAHVFGYCADGNDIKRAQRLRRNFFELDIRTPLITKGLTKEHCLAMLESAGIAAPAMYGLGFHNNNCIPCVKAQSPNYWALIRREFPAEFERMVALSRELGVRLTKIAGERRFIDEIPAGQPVTEAIAPACDFLCQMAEDDLSEAGDE